MSPRKRLVLTAAGTAQLSLMTAALIDIRRRSPDQVRGSRRMWTALSFVNTIGPLCYFAFGRRKD